jgi:hypothetical protein
VPLPVKELPGHAAGKEVILGFHQNRVAGFPR